MTTKKAEQSKTTPPKRERGRVAKMLQNGYTLEVTPSKKAAKAGQATKPQPASSR